MKIWEPKPPGTLWATPGLLRDGFNFFYFIFQRSLLSFPQHPVHEPPPPPNLCLSLNTTDLVPHPYKTKGKTLVLYILAFIFSYSKLDYGEFCIE